MNAATYNAKASADQVTDTGTMWPYQVARWEWRKLAANVAVGEKVTVTMDGLGVQSSEANPGGLQNPLIYLRNVATPTKHGVVTMHGHVFSVAVDDWYEGVPGIYGDPTPPSLEPALMMVDPKAVWTVEVRVTGNTTIQYDIRSSQYDLLNQYWSGQVGAGGTGLCVSGFEVYLGWVPDDVSKGFDNLQGIQPLMTVGNGCVNARYLSAVIAAI